MISHFPLELTRFFLGKQLIHFLVLKIKDIRNFVLTNCILVLDAEQVYLNLKPPISNKEVTVNLKPQTLFFPQKALYPIPWTLDPRHQICPKP